MGLSSHISIYAECDSCCREITDEVLYDVEPEDVILEEIGQDIAESSYGAYDITVSGEYYEILCENCWCEVREECSWCGSTDLVWADDSFWCGDDSFNPEHNCPEEAHQQWVREDPDSFEFHGECTECGYELRSIPGPKGEGTFSPLIKLKVSA